MSQVNTTIMVDEHTDGLDVEYKSSEHSQGGKGLSTLTFDKSA